MIQFSTRSTHKPLLPPTYLLIALVTMLGLHFAIPFFRWMPIPWNLLGLLPLGMGIYINLVADHQFRQVQTTVKPFEQPSCLLTEGFYRFSRNPMYLGFVLILAGVGILLGSMTPFVVLPIFITLIQLIFIRDEEQMMAATFGQSWLDYTKKVRRWL